MWKFPKQIYEKIIAAMQPSDEDIEAGKKPIDVFDLETGADFVLKIKTGQYGADYSGSYFTTPRPLFDKEDAIQAIFEKIYDLKEYVDPSVYKSFEDTKKRFEYVYAMGDANAEEDADENPAPVAAAEPEKKKKAAPVSPDPDEKEGDEDVGDYFAKLDGKK